MQNNKKNLIFYSFFDNFFNMLERSLKNRKTTKLKIEKLREMVEKQENFTAQEKKIIQNF